MNIAIVGYGKMGHAVERFARQRGHNICCIIDADQQEKFASPEFASADVAIEFTTPATAVDNYRRILAAGVPLVSGTTGWLDQMDRVKAMLADAPQGMFWTSNFSIGVALFNRILAAAAALIDPYLQYTPSLHEVHHIHKLDHPSGTAVTAAQTIIDASSRLTRWAESAEDTPAAGTATPAAGTATPSDTPSDTLIISHERIGEVPGTHIARWTSPVDSITIEHRAFSRDGFALGAVVAAEWMATRRPRGLSSMADLLSNL